MKYMLLIYGDEARQAALTPEQLGQQLADYDTFTQEALKRSTIVASEALMPTQTATSVRVRDGRTLTTDGPFAETKEALGGFYLLDCKDLDEAIELAAKIPDATTGTIEIRPVVVFES